MNKYHQMQWPMQAVLAAEYSARGSMQQASIRQGSTHCPRHLYVFQQNSDIYGAVCCADLNGCQGRRVGSGNVCGGLLLLCGEGGDSCQSRRRSSFCSSCCVLHPNDLLQQVLHRGLPASNVSAASCDQGRQAGVLCIGLHVGTDRFSHQPFTDMILL